MESNLPNEFSSRNTFSVNNDLINKNGLHHEGLESHEELNPIDTIRDQTEASFQKRKSNSKKRFTTAILSMVGAGLATAGIAFLAVNPITAPILVIGIGAALIGTAILAGGIKHGIDHTSPGNIVKDLIIPVIAGITMGIGLGMMIGVSAGATIGSVGATASKGSLAPIFGGLAMTSVGALSIFSIAQHSGNLEDSSEEIPKILNYPYSNSEENSGKKLDDEFQKLLEKLEINTKNRNSFIEKSNLNLSIENMETYKNHIEKLEFSEGLSLLKGSNFFTADNIRGLDNASLDTFIKLAKKGKDKDTEALLLKESVMRMGVSKESEENRIFSVDKEKLNRLGVLTSNTLLVNKFIKSAVQEYRNNR